MIDYRKEIISRRKSWIAQHERNEETMEKLQVTIDTQLSEIHAIYDSVADLLEFDPWNTFISHHSGFRLYRQGVSNGRTEYTVSGSLEEGIVWQYWHGDSGPQLYAFESVKNDLINWCAKRIRIDENLLD